jgi:hypothetical protein
MGFEGRPRAYLWSKMPSYDKSFATTLDDAWSRKAMLRSRFVKQGLLNVPSQPMTADDLLRLGLTIAERNNKQKPQDPELLADGERVKQDDQPARELRVENATSTGTYDAVARTGTVKAGFDTWMPWEQLAQNIDPRSWGKKGSVVAATFRLEDEGGEYRPIVGKEPLGSPWKGLLYELARCDIASFENVLDIEFETGKVKQGRDRGKPYIRAMFSLYDCLKSTIGFMVSDGGLQIDSGTVEAIKHGAYAHCKMTKNIRVRTTFPNHPGGKYDPGNWANTTIASWLSLWVDDGKLLSPLT